MSFGQILSRGFIAANRTPVGVLLYFVVLGVQQGLTVLAGGLVSPEVFQVQPGEEPPPELFAAMGFGCFMCFWGLLALFATPWITGGVVGQLRDRIAQPTDSPLPFAEYGGRFYGRMLVLALIWLALFVAIWLAMMLVGAAIAGDQIEPGQTIQPDQWQAMNRHPANIASAVVLFLLLNIMGMVWGMAQAIVVVDDRGALASLSDGCRFWTRHMGDAVKYFLIFATLNAVLWIPGPLLAAFEVEGMAVRAAIALLVALYFPYLIVLGLGCAISLYLARKSEPAIDAKIAE